MAWQVECLPLSRPALSLLALRPGRHSSELSMRVLHFFKTYLPDTTGGIEQVIFQLSEGCRTLAVESEVLTLSRQPQPQRVQVGEHWVTRAQENINLASTGFSLQAFGLFREMAKEADLVHFHFPWPVMDLVHFASRHGRPTAVSYHSDIVRQKMLLRLYRPLMRHFLASVDRILVASPNYLDSSEVLREYRDKTTVVPFGLDAKAYPVPATERLAYWRQHCGEGFFLFVGVLRYYKGLHHLLDALAGTDFPLVIVGSGPMEAELKAQAERLQLRNVLFLGRLDDADKMCLLHLCLALVFPSHLRSEAFGISLLEAAMCGKPMVSCEIGTGTTFVNLDGETGYAVPPGDPAALRAAMTRLRAEPVQSAKLGANARQRFEALFRAERMCEKMAQIYWEIVEERQSL